MTITRSCVLIIQHLLATGDLMLKPDHHQEPNAPAAWRYFEILMQIRKELQKQAVRTGSGSDRVNAQPE